MKPAEENMRKVACLIGLVAVLGCDDNRNVAVSNTNPLGTVGGVMLDVEGEGAIVGGDGDAAVRPGRR